VIAGVELVTGPALTPLADALELSTSLHKTRHLYALDQDHDRNYLRYPKVAFAPAYSVTRVRVSFLAAAICATSVCIQIRTRLHISDHYDFVGADLA
jgi:hypothetical protein